MFSESATTSWFSDDELIALLTLSQRLHHLDFALLFGFGHLHFSASMFYGFLLQIEVEKSDYMGIGMRLISQMLKGVRASKRTSRGISEKSGFCNFTHEEPNDYPKTFP